MLQKPPDSSSDDTNHKAKPSTRGAEEVGSRPLMTEGESQGSDSVESESDEHGDMTGRSMLRSRSFIVAAASNLSKTMPMASRGRGQRTAGNSSHANDSAEKVSSPEQKSPGDMAERLKPGPSKSSKSNDAEEDAMTALESTNIPSVSINSHNAFTELMARKTQKQSTTSPDLRRPNPNTRRKGDARDALGVCATNPDSVPNELRIYSTNEFVVVKDLYPKSSVHTLLLFRHPKNTLHPFHFFEDPVILAKAREEIKGIRSLVAAELQKLYGRFSKQDEQRQKALRGEITIPEGQGLPKGRDWQSEVMIGVHAVPSMNHVHVHIMSKDRVSPHMKKRNHYNSFNTLFFVGIDEFPLAHDDPRWDTYATNGYIREAFRCWRCKRANFKSFPDLKQHLAEEFEEWKAE